MAQRAFYRSIVVRVAFITSGLFLAYTLSPLGPGQWRNTPSLRWLHQLLPWPVLSAGWLIYVALLVWGRTVAVVVADGLGLFMYLCGFVALVATTRLDRPANPLAICGVLLACIIHYAAARLMTFQHEQERLR